MFKGAANVVACLEWAVKLLLGVDVNLPSRSLHLHRRFYFHTSAPDSRNSPLGGNNIEILRDPPFDLNTLTRDCSC